MTTNPSDHLSGELHLATQVLGHRAELLNNAQNAGFHAPRIPTVEELLKAASSLNSSLASAGFCGMIDGGRFGLEMESYLSGSAIQDALPGIESSFPISTAITQSVRQLGLLYQGHIDAQTAIIRVVADVASVGVASVIGSSVGTALIPGIGTVLGGMIGGWLGRYFGRAIIEREYTSARDAYLLAEDHWRMQIETTRVSSNDELSRITHVERSRYQRDLRKLPRFGYGLARRFIHYGELYAASAIDYCTRKAASENGSYSALRESTARILCSSNNQSMRAARLEHLWLERRYQRAQASIERAFTYKLNVQVKLVQSMIADLNQHYASVQLALKRLGVSKQ